MINIPKDAQNEIRSGMSGGDYIELPFFAPFFYWTRGDPNAALTGSSAAHFGGWSSSAQGIDQNFDTVPPGLVKEQRSGTDGMYEVYSTRYLTVALIAQRKRWAYANEADTRGRSHAQYLCLAANFDKQRKEYVPWTFPVVLSLKGMVTVDFEKVVKTWEKETANHRKMWADGGHASFFWMTVGTFGQQRQDKQVGKTQKSYITPPQLYIPFGGNAEAWEQEQFIDLYVGDTEVNSMIDVKRAADEWLRAWKEAAASRPEKQQSSSGDDDMPF